MWFKLGSFCSESPKWKWKLFQPPWLEKAYPSWSTLEELEISACWLKEGRQPRLLVYCFGKYSLLLIRMALRGVNPCSYGRLFLSLFTHFAAVGGSIWTQTWFGIYGDCLCESSYSFAMLFAWISSCITLCLLFSLHGSTTTLHRDELVGKSTSTQWDLGSSSSFSQAVTPLPFNIWPKSFSLIYCRCFWNKRWATASLPHVLAGDRRLCEITWEMG